MTTTGPGGSKPTVVLVHGVWGDATGWDGVTRRLQADGYPVLAPANPLRGLASDAAYVASVLDTVPGPIVLVGHSYGGAVITNAATGKANVKALVYVAGFALEEGEDTGTANVRFMAERAGATIVEVEASHAVLVSRPAEVADLIRTAAAAGAPGGA
jgi:pimeloyl-ACP methyl ester carboxylesterase